MTTLPFDPSQALIQLRQAEPAVAAHLLSLDGLRRRFAASAVWSSEFGDAPAPLTADRPLVPASVLVPIVARGDELSVLLTLRTAHLHDHAGQISFPGGRVDIGDADAIATALRETEEEIGLSRQHIEVLGSLPDYQTGTGFLVTPVVSLVHPPFALAADTFEVAEIFEVPLAFLMDAANHQRRSAEFPGRAGLRHFYAIPYRDYFIWGATAAMLRNLYHFLRAE